MAPGLQAVECGSFSEGRLRGGLKTKPYRVANPNSPVFAIDELITGQTDIVMVGGMRFVETGHDSEPLLPDEDLTTHQYQTTFNDLEKRDQRNPVDGRAGLHGFVGQHELVNLPPGNRSRPEVLEEQPSPVGYPLERGHYLPDNIPALGIAIDAEYFRTSHFAGTRLRLRIGDDGVPGFTQRTVIFSVDEHAHEGGVPRRDGR